jgi:hypothetical protein
MAPVYWMRAQSRSSRPSPEPSLLFGCFGSTRHRSTTGLDHRYLSIYLLILLIIFLAVGIYIALASRSDVRAGTDAGQPQRVTIPLRSQTKRTHGPGACAVRG